MKWFVLIGTCSATIAYLAVAGLLDDPRMIFIGFYGAGAALYGFMEGRS